MARNAGRIVAAIAGLAAIGGLAWLAIGRDQPAEVERAELAADPPIVVAETDEAELDETSYQDLVADAQRILSLRGYDPGPIDGKLGLRTQEAMRAYRQAVRTNGLLDAIKQDEPAQTTARDVERYSFDARPTPRLIGGD